MYSQCNSHVTHGIPSPSAAAPTVLQPPNGSATSPPLGQSHLMKNLCNGGFQKLLNTKVSNKGNQQSKDPKKH
jgi:hypothetical protein